MNFLDGEVGASGGAPRFGAEELDIPLARYRFDEPAPGPALRARHPPGTCRHGDAGEDWPFSHEVEVEIVEPMGSDTLVWTKLGRQNFTIRVDFRAHACMSATRSPIGFDPMNAPRCSTTRERQTASKFRLAQHEVKRHGKRIMNWSFQLYSARNFQPWDKVLKLLGEAGYKEVEGYGGVYADPAGLRKELDKNGLTMPTGHFSIDTAGD